MFVKRIMEITSCFCWCCCCFLEANNAPCFDSLWHSSNRSKKQPHASSNFQWWFYFSVLGLLVLVEQILDCNTNGNSSVFFFYLFSFRNTLYRIYLTSTFWVLLLLRRLIYHDCFEGLLWRRFWNVMMCRAALWFSV